MSHYQDTPLIIEVSLNGSVKKSQNPSVPYTDDEIVSQAVECMEAGAALVHNHTEDPVFGGSGAMDAEAYARPWRKLLAVRPDAILTPTMAADPGGVSAEVRYAHIEAMAAEGLIAQGLCDPGTFNVTMPGADGAFAPTQLIYRNDAQDSHYYVEACRRLKLGMSISIFEPGFVKFIMSLHRAGTLPAGGIMKFYFAAKELSFGLLPTAASLDAYLEMIDGSGLPWLVSAFGDDCVGCGLAEAAIKRGGHIQVGLEPYGGPRTPRNIELVQEVVELAKSMGRPIATPAQAAQIMKLPTYPVAYGAV